MGGHEDSRLKKPADAPTDAPAGYYPCLSRVVVEGCGQVLGAMAGRRVAKEGLRKVVSGLPRGVESLSGALEVYRMFLYLEGNEERETEGAAKLADASFPLTRPPGTLSLGERGGVRCDGAAAEEMFTVRDLRVDVFG